MKKTLLAMSILLGLLGFSACGEASNRTVYQYRETEVFQNFYVKTTRSDATARILRTWAMRLRIRFKTAF